MKTLKIITLGLVLFMVSCGSNPDKSRNFYDQGLDYLYASQFEESIEYFDKAIKYDQNNHEAYFHRGCAKYNIFQREAA